MVTRKEVIEKVQDFVNRKYSGDWKACFDAHDEDGDGKLSCSEITVILAKSNIGYKVTRWAIAEQIITLMDSDNDDYVSFNEFKNTAHTILVGSN